MSDLFGCAVNCIDGRAQVPIIEWVKFHAGVEFVDMITEPGADGVLAHERQDETSQIHGRLQTAVGAHNPGIIAVCGHFDCVGNPVSDQEHIIDIQKSMEIVSSWFPERRVVGLFVNEFGSVDKVCDTSEGDSALRSFL